MEKTLKKRANLFVIRADPAALCYQTPDKRFGILTLDTVQHFMDMIAWYIP